MTINEIKRVINRLEMASINNNWYTINDQTKYLTKLLKDRNFYINNFKTNNKIKEEEEMNIKEIINKLIDLDNEKIGYKIRSAQLQKTPYMAVVGAKEEENGTISVRSRKDGDLGAVSYPDFLQKLQEEIAEKRA